MGLHFLETAVKQISNHFNNSLFVYVVIYSHSKQNMYIWLAYLYTESGSQYPT